ncbi:ankyrin repeat, SAM and basic leucine zipper domain-containing protein 1 [Calliopsis andreniformis]|uniref:ankyrin repeat, SAM and basic leucine zipper domain-containing protein 1 n=1 Tax=Calliopsis andreniformis TaxID=337506 RepID=UPI003FCDF21C
MYTTSTRISDNEFEDDEDFVFPRKNYSQTESRNAFNQYQDDINEDYEEHILECQMMNACIMNCLDIVQEYLKSHDVNNFLHTGWTPLLYAAFYAQREIIEYLIKNGANVNKHQDGYTPLMALCSSTKGTIEERIQCLNLLLEAKANTHACNKQRQTPLMYACKSQESEFVAELIKHSKNINACDNRNQTALMYATIANKLETVKLLIDSGADVTLIDCNNLTASEIASTKGYDKIASLLNSDEEEIIDVCKMSHISDWTDMFPSLININNKTIDFDIYTILHGMGLEKYAPIFQGMTLKHFLKLTENDLHCLGVEINAHRVQFMEQLHKFHRKKWSVQSIGIINKSLPYTIVNSIISLGTIAKQVAVIGSSFYYVKTSLLNASNKNVHLTKEQAIDYELKLKKAQKTLSILKQELVQLKTLSKKIEKENDLGIPATYIGPKKHSSHWPILLSVAVITGIYLSRTVYVQRLITN